MQIFSESDSYLENIGIKWVQKSMWTLIFPWEKIPLNWFQSKDKENIWMILLSERDTLYNTSLQDLDKIRQQVEVDVLWLICSKLTTPKWAQKRSWIQNQMWSSNFNINIITNDPITTGINQREIIDLQKKICLWVHQTLKNFLPENEHSLLEVKYPFHYSFKWGKIAWHLVQRDSRAMRIWIWINSNFSPVLPRNDEMWQKIYNWTSSLDLNNTDWYNFGTTLIKNITKNIHSDNINNNFKEIINLKQWDSANIYEDLWSIHFWSKVSEWKIDVGDIENGKIWVWWKVFDYWYGHLVKNTES